jgi:hypothetical protein
MLRDGALTRHADARRMRVFDFDIFFFGTGISVGRFPAARRPGGLHTLCFSSWRAGFGRPTDAGATA